ncbi:MAG: hypothetical protein LBU15_02030 [Rickettsiales bacterium]|jgi:hypothetical protein|nr:hypothetical protein [Rickettsiales bacterium]
MVKSKKTSDKTSVIPSEAWDTLKNAFGDGKVATATPTSSLGSPQKATGDLEKGSKDNGGKDVPRGI